MSIFKETFKDFVLEQLRIREAIIERGNNPTKFQHRFGNPRLEIPSEEDRNEGDSFKTVNLPAGAFYTNTVHKQCVIRMSSGVDITNDAILEETEKNLIGRRLAEKYILEGGILDENKKQKEGFARNNGAYGDKSTRSDAKDGFGIVPMPGIVDADIRTKTAYGSLREAKVNFVCHSRRQLEILELLYMRPGMPVLLEWQWSPFINNEGRIDSKGNYGIGDDWFTYKKTISDFNEIIIETKEKTGGNYDGFVGFCKNFEISSRPDGGYDCTTELIATGEVLEGLKARRDGYSISTEDEDVRVEIDNMELILKGILELSDINSRYGGGNVFTFLDDEIVGGGVDSLIKKFLKEDQPSGILLEVITGNTIGDKTQGEGNNKRFIVNEFLKKYTDKDFLWKGEFLGVEHRGFWKGGKVQLTNKHHTFISWKTLCDLVNKLVFPLPDPMNDAEPLLKLVYTEIKNGKEEPLKIVPYVFGKEFIFESKYEGASPQESVTKNGTSLLDNSFNPKICLLPNQNADMSNNPHNIGSIMLNVEHLKDTYMQMAYSGDAPVEDFNLFDYFNKIWEDVNTACVGHHNFTLQTELERPDRIRIIDLKIDPPNIPLKDLFEFKIQSNKSIVRDFNYNTTIPSGLSATIAIAAQAPSNISDLDQVTFKNFSKDIRSRFAKNGIQAPKKSEIFLNKNILDADISRLSSKIDALRKYLEAIYEGESEENEVLEETFTDVQGLAKSIEALIFSILSRDPKTGLKLEKIPNRKSAVIPLKFNCKMDGISGIVIGHVFKVEKEKLPKGYQADDIAFVVMGESQKISSDQDWTTEISGQLVLLDLEGDTKTIIVEENLLTYEDQTLRTDNLTVLLRDEYDFSDEIVTTVEDQVLKGPIPTYEAERLLDQIKGNGTIYVGTSADSDELIAEFNATQIAKRSLLSSIGLVESYTTDSGEIQWENVSFIEVEREYDGINMTIKFKFE